MKLSRKRHFKNRKPHKGMRPQIHETTAAAAAAQEIKRQGSNEQRETKKVYLCLKFLYKKWNRKNNVLAKMDRNEYFD